MPNFVGQNGLGSTKEPILLFYLEFFQQLVGWHGNTKVKIRREPYSHQRDDSEALGEQVRDQRD